MSDKVVFLHPPAPPLGHYLRVGSSGHRQLETLLSANRVSIERFVLEATRMERKRDLLAALCEPGCEMILDTVVAELSSPKRYSGAARTAPWANQSRPLSPEDLVPSSPADVIGHIARFAVETGFDAVLAPTHVLRDSADPILGVDLKSAEALRVALDRHGGKDIGIDYPLMLPYAVLRDRAEAEALIDALSGIAFDNLWFRVSGFGADASPSGVQRYISALFLFHSLKRPIVADSIGGLAGLAALAFGAAGGICHGAAEKERFDATSWEAEGSSRGGERRVLIEGLDRLLSASQATTLMESPGGRRHFGCNNSACCLRGFDDTLRDPKAHYLHQRQEQVAELSRVPRGRRAIHFLDHQLLPAKTKAQQGARIRLSDDSISNILRRARSRLEKLHTVLRSLRTTISGRDGSLPPIRRSGISGAKSRRRR